jgi:hypothetical protein
MRTLDVEEMESPYKINLKDVLWWMSIKDAYRPGVPITIRLSKKSSKKRCISLVVGKRLSYVPRKHD